MKSHVRPYTGYLLKRNTSYLVVAGILLVATCAMGWYLNTQIAQIDANIKETNLSIATLNAKQQTLRSVTGESTDSLDQDLQLMSALIPDTEDYFSIINALETLSVQTGFRIDSYIINLLASTSNKLSLSVVGNGDSTAFLNFLQNYQINGGRLITAEKIGIDPTETGSIRLDLNFYNRNASSDVASVSGSLAPSLQQLKEIKSKVTFSLSGEPTADQPIQTYDTKQNPF